MPEIVDKQDDLPKGENEIGSAQQESRRGGLLSRLNSSRLHGKQAARNLAAEIELHPLVSIMTGIFLGYLIAKLWYKDN